MSNNNYIVNEYIINNHYNDFIGNTMQSFTSTTTLNDPEEFMQEQEYRRNIQEYENELIREQQLRIRHGEIEERMEEMTELFINEIISITQRISNQNYHENIIDEDLYFTNGEELIEICSICLDDVTYIETTSRLSCGHHFHTDCIRMCLERSLRCPLCRQDCLRNK
jgi:hypothetical protein